MSATPRAIAGALPLLVWACLVQGCSGERTIAEARAAHERALFAAREERTQSLKSMRLRHRQETSDSEARRRRETRDLEAEWRKELDLLEDQCELEIEEAEKDLEARRIKRWERWRAELRKECGGELAGISSDPTLSIRGMLLELARAVAPERCVVYVFAWEFVEFRVQFDSLDGFTHRQAAAVAKQFLVHGARAAYQIEFRHDRRIQYVVHRAAIERRPGWSNASLPEVMRVVEEY